MQTERMRLIHDTAVRLFLRQGYAKTQISHIAREAGVSVGTIYQDFESKEALRDFVLQTSLEPERIYTRPVTARQFPDLEKRLIAALEQSADTFAANLPRAGAEYPFRTLLSDTFHLLARHGAGCLFLEKNPLVFPMVSSYYRSCRENFFQTMTWYLEACQRGGQLRSLEEPELTAVFIMESLSWWAMDVRYPAFEAWEIPPERAEAV